MGGGDLNLKKSWHTGLLSNQRKVWDAEQSKLADLKKIEQVRRERDEERQIEELARLAEASGGTKRHHRVEWLYSGANAGSMGTSEEQEAYLLGKRRVDNLITKQEVEKKEVVVERDPARDVAAKVALDPLLAIEKQRQEALEKAMAVEAKIAERESRRERHDRKKSRRHDDEKRERDRSRSPYERRERKRRSESDSEEKRDRHRSESRHGSGSPHRSGNRRDDYEERPRKQGRSDRHSSGPRHGSSSPHRRENRREDYEERLRKPERSDRYRSRSPPRRRSRDRHHKEDRRDRNRDFRQRDQPVEKLHEDDRAAKLAAMQADASNLEEDRMRRLEALEKRDAETREREERKRAKGGNFKSTLYQQTEGVGLGDRLKGARSRGMLSI